MNLGGIAYWPKNFTLRSSESDHFVVWLTKRALSLENHELPSSLALENI